MRRDEVDDTAANDSFTCATAGIRVASLPRMFHHVGWSVPGTLLFRCAEEADALWRVMTATFPELVALCLMPDHVHLLLPHRDSAGRLARAESAFARWRNHSRRARGPVWAPHPPVEEIPPDRDRRVIRYVLLNPCRKALARDPLAWPWSTHRDRVGFAAPRVGPAEREPARFHAHVSSDGTTEIGGTPFPQVQHREFDWGDLSEAVCAVARVAPDAVRARTPARALAIRAAWVHGLRDVHRLGAETGLHAARIYQLVKDLPSRDAAFADERLAACVTVVGDARFRPVQLDRLPGWWRYAGRR